MRAIITFLFLVVFIPLLAQKQSVQVLDKPITLDVSGKAISEVLILIGQQTGVKFSYSPAVISSDRKVTFRFKNKPLRVVLEHILGEQIQFKARNNFVIITPKPAPTTKEPTEVTITGYVYNEDGEGLAFASLYSKSLSVSAVTNASGYFKITYPVSKTTTTFNVRKASYRDTSVVVTSTKSKLEITLQPQKNVVVQKAIIAQEIHADTIAKKDTLQQLVEIKSSTIDSASTPIGKLKKWFLSPETQANIRNISDTLFSKVQLSFVPQLSTNKLLVGNTVNKVSVSALIGYNKAVDLISVAGLMNVINEKAGYVNVAGIANVIGDSMIGAEVAGVANLNNGLVNGAQVAGVINVTPKKVEGAQVAGVMNLAGDDVSGAEIAGVVNILEGEMRGGQIAGTLNITRGNVYGTQLAGTCNVAISDTINTQISGTLNIAHGNVYGAQIAGSVNLASGTVRGAQVSGVLNIAKDVYGAQIGLINISKNIHGVPIGLLSISKNGYHKLEVYGDESMYTQLAFRTGARAFHNIFTAGVDLTNRVDGLWNFGYGIGSFYQLPRNWNTGFEIVSQTCLVNSLNTNVVWLYGVNYLFEKQFTPKFSIGFGPTFKLMHNPNSGSTIADVISPYQLANYSLSNGGELRFWVGGKISIKLF